MKSPIYINGRFTAQKVTGIQRYAHEISRRLRAKEDVEFLDLPVRCASNRVLSYLWEQIGLPLSLPGSGVLWSPTGSGPFAVGRQVVTFHDGVVLSHPEWFSKAYVLRRRLLLPLLLRRARKIITVSQFSKRHICTHAPVESGEVEVIYNGVNHDQFYPVSERRVKETRDQLDLPEHYLLALGALEPRKNFGRLLRAWERAERQLSDECFLVLAGGSVRVLKDVSLRTRSERVKVLGYVADEHLAPLYSGAAAFAYPSLLEGFGLPVLEAMACGTPVVTSNVTSLPEVAGEAAVLVDPFDVDAIAEGVTRVLEDRTLQEELRRKGLERAGQFTWERAAEETWRVLAEAAR